MATIDELKWGVRRDAVPLLQDLDSHLETRNVQEVFFLIRQAGGRLLPAIGTGGRGLGGLVVVVDNRGDGSEVGLTGEKKACVDLRLSQLVLHWLLLDETKPLLHLMITQTDACFWEEVLGKEVVLVELLGLQEGGSVHLLLLADVHHSQVLLLQRI